MTAKDVVIETSVPGTGEDRNARPAPQRTADATPSAPTIKSYSSKLRVTSAGAAEAAAASSSSPAARAKAAVRLWRSGGGHVGIRGRCSETMKL